MSGAFILLAPMAVKESLDPWLIDLGKPNGSDRAEGRAEQTTAARKRNLILLHNIVNHTPEIRVKQTRVRIGLLTRRPGAKCGNETKREVEKS